MRDHSFCFQVGAMLKQFLPQLQTTFVKALNDGNRIVRVKAAVATGHLIKIHTRPDPIYTELHNSIKNLEDSSIRYVPCLCLFLHFLNFYLIFT